MGGFAEGGEWDRGVNGWCALNDDWKDGWMDGCLDGWTLVFLLLLLGQRTELREQLCTYIVSNVFVSFDGRNMFGCCALAEPWESYDE